MFRDLYLFHFKKINLSLKQNVWICSRYRTSPYYLSHHNNLYTNKACHWIRFYTGNDIYFFISNAISWRSLTRNKMTVIKESQRCCNLLMSWWTKTETAVITMRRNIYKDLLSLTYSLPRSSHLYNQYPCYIMLVTTLRLTIKVSFWIFRK